MIENQCVIYNCFENTFHECCYGMCGKHCSEKKHHYLENGEIKYPNIRKLQNLNARRI